MLNAFRHHGERDSSLGLLASLAQMLCSTPSGITASATGESPHPGGQ
ncbi:hypothetical protein A176_007260 [Myxococcus hansupus]|uniref:Uncharacterized protein n=1 Tax=Pseudomyxococcus hansupus TaxID=1297742 RepID=A0A0H4X8M9_9BACT|nr:hypothetical protein A176_007260 [Myxococcus hansupus]